MFLGKANLISESMAQKKKKGESPFLLTYLFTHTIGLHSKGRNSNGEQCHQENHRRHCNTDTPILCQSYMHANLAIRYATKEAVPIAQSTAISHSMKTVIALERGNQI